MISLVIFIFTWLLSAYFPLYVISEAIQFRWITWPMDMAPSDYHPVTTTLSLTRALMVFILAPLLYIAVFNRNLILRAFKVGKFPSVIAVLISVSL